MPERTTPKLVKPQLVLPPGMTGTMLREELTDRAAVDYEANRPRVCVGLMSAGQVDLQMAGSLLSVMMRQQQTGQHHLVGSVTVESGPRIAEGRSKVVESFLFGEPLQHCDWLWFVDSDMTFEPDALDRLLATAIELEAKVVGGLCFAGGHSDRIFPTIYRLVPDEDDGFSTEPVENYEHGAVIKVGGTGAACLLVHREVLTRMLIAFGKQTNGNPSPYPWFIEGMTATGKAYGEDVAFCIRAQQLGYGIFVDTNVRVGHRKTLELNETLFDARMAAIPDLEAVVGQP